MTQQFLSADLNTVRNQFHIFVIFGIYCAIYELNEIEAMWISSYESGHTKIKEQNWSKYIYMHIGKICIIFALWLKWMHGHVFMTISIVSIVFVYLFYALTIRLLQHIFNMYTQNVVLEFICIFNISVSLSARVLPLIRCHFSSISNAIIHFGLPIAGFDIDPFK